MRGGISVSVARDFSAGTLGGLVRDRTTGDLMILSNWHVLAAERWVAAGLPICQPGRLDGGMPYDVVATTTRHAMRQNIDAAVATLTGDRPLINDQLNIGSVTGVALPRLGMRVTKSGRTTGVTEGIITGVEGQARLWYGSMQRTIQHVIPSFLPLESVKSAQGATRGRGGSMSKRAQQSGCTLPAAMIRNRRWRLRWSQFSTRLMLNL